MFPSAVGTHALMTALMFNLRCVLACTCYLCCMTLLWLCLSQETDTSHFSADTEHVTYDLYCNMVNKEGEEEHIFA